MTAKAEVSRAIPADVWKLALTVMAGGVVVGLDATMTNVALNTFLTEFDAPLSTVQWIGTGYLLAMTMAIPVTGWAIDRFGAKRMWLLALGLFLLGSVLCGLAWSAPTLIAARVIQGAGAGMILPLAQTLLAQAAGPALLGRVMAALGVPAMLGPVLGPVVGGLILDHLSWRWIFLINIPICVIAIYASWRVMPASRATPVDRGTSSVRLDALGLALLSPGCALLVYGLAEAGRLGTFAEVRALGPLLIGVALLVGFVAHALRTHAVPLIDLRLFRSATFAAPTAVIFLSAAALFGAIILIPLYAQQVRGASALEAGLLMAPQGLGMGAALIVSGRLADRLSPRPIVLTGLALAGLASLFFTQLGPGTNQGLIAAALVVSGLGLGTTLVPVMATPLRFLQPTQIPRASTAIRIFQQLGGSFAGAAVAIILQRRLVAVTDGGAEAMSAAFAGTFWWLLVVAVVALIPALLLPGSRPTAGRIAQDDAHGS